MNQPTVTMAELIQQQRYKQRTGSTKSLHHLENPWQANPMYNANPRFNPMMMNPMMMAANPSLHRSMHELNQASQAMFNPYQPRPLSPGGKSVNSSRSKKSVRSTTSKQKSNKRQTDPRSTSRNSRRNSKRPPSRQSLGRRSKHCSTSEEEDDVSESNKSESEEDFFTGESDNDFVSLSSGSNPRKAPKKSWTCEHCTYVNNPGVSVCCVCCRTSKQSRGEEPPSAPHYQPQLINQSLKKKAGRRNSKYESSDEEDFRPSSSHSRRSKAEKKSSSLKRRSKARSQQKTPLPNDDDEEQKKMIDLEQDALDTYYSLRVEGGKGREMMRYESSSETSSVANPMRQPNFDAPAPTKGILKKASSNPQLTKLELEDKKAARSEMGVATKTLDRHFGPGKVIDIKKYLAQNNQQLFAPASGSSGDIWQNEKADWVRRNMESPKSTPNEDYLSDVETNPGGRMYRSMSGQSLGDMDYNAASKQQQQRRVSEAGKRNFRSKRFSRNLEREPALRRSHSLHAERVRDDDWAGGRPRRASESSNEDVQSESKGPGGIGSYLARQEFGSNEGQPPTSNAQQDSGYVSHGSGGGYPKLQLPTQAPIESFTMSVDRGFLGRAPGDKDPALFKSMDDLSTQKATGLELVRLLREAEQSGYTAEDVQVSLNHCGDANPVNWLNENWHNMMETVMTLASNVGHEAEENTIGTLSKSEAKEALRKHKGNIWAAVTECVEQRQVKVSHSISRKKNALFFISIINCSTMSCAAKGISREKTL